MSQKDVLPLSVIVPVFNVAPYLPRCLDSILGQTQPVREIICVDDGSTDESGEILDAYAAKHEQIRVVHKENGGLVSARKAGIALVTSPYTTSVDSDDFIDADMCEQMMKLMLEADADVVTGGYIKEYGNRQVVEKEFLKAGLYAGEDVQKLLGQMVSTEEFFRMSITPSQGGKIYRTEQLRTFQNQVDSRISTGEDVVVIWPLLLHARRIVVSGKEFYHYCWRGDSIGGTFSEDDGRRVETFLAYLKQHFMEIRSKVPNIMMQYWLEEAYTWFMRDAERIVAIHEDELFPFGRVSKSARIVIYGAGRVGQQMKRFLDRHGYDVVAWVDQDTNKDGVLSPLALAGMSYDIVLISTVKASILHSIEQDLKKLGVPMGKIRKIEVQALLKGVEADG